MKKWLVVLMAVVVSGCQEKESVETPSAPDAEQEQVEHAGWMTDFEEAKVVAKELGKHILIDFSGSDWCGWCVRLDKEVFSKQAFKEYASDNLVLMLADFPRDKSSQSEGLRKQNSRLAEEFKVGGFPTVFILSPEGKTIAKTGYQEGGAEAYVEHIKKLIAESK